MRAAPVVDATLDTGRRERVLIVVLHAVAGAVLSAWALSHIEAGPSLASVAVGVSVALASGLLGLVLARRGLPPSPHRLRWDGQAWSLQLAPMPGVPVAADAGALSSVVITLDLGAWLLLRLQMAGGDRRWRVASLRSAGPAWHGLRVALLAHGGPAPVERAGSDGGRVA